jgi:hypothetical protein
LQSCAMTPDNSLHWAQDGFCQTIAPDLMDEFLDDLLQVQAAGYLDEYVTRLLKKKQWELPDGLESRTLVAFYA